MKFSLIVLFVVIATAGVAKVTIFSNSSDQHAVPEQSARDISRSVEEQRDVVNSSALTIDTAQIKSLESSEGERSVLPVAINEKDEQPSAAIAVDPVWEDQFNQLMDAEASQANIGTISNPDNEQDFLAAASNELLTSDYLAENSSNVDLGDRPQETWESIERRSQLENQFSQSQTASTNLTSPNNESDFFNSAVKSTR